MNKQLILGDILVNSINNRQLSEIVLTPKMFEDFKTKTINKNIELGEIELSYEDLGIKLTPIILNCKYNHELIFPEINLDNERKIIKLIFGFQIDKNITINLI